MPLTADDDIKALLEGARTIAHGRRVRPARPPVLWRDGDAPGATAIA